MESAAQDSESQQALRGSVNSGGHQKSGGKPEPRHNRKKNIIALAVALTVVSLGLISAVIVQAVLRPKLLSDDPGPPAGSACPEGWVGYRKKCYYFSETEGNWTYSQSHCSSLGASLAGIDREQEKAFLLRHKGVHEHWIGLRREQGQPWKWANGTEFNHPFVIRGGGDCAYLNGGNEVSSSQCYMERLWICSKPEVYVMGKGTALEGSSK
ncbi:C-type lectin domain family 2 member D-like [Chrysemys picta bellii]|uniref:C-type lectin domain family 2 member D-like n=1 Tax=Chrysemys picta bellii TaxID=8478 RepID=UPI0032B21547